MKKKECSLCQGCLDTHEHVQYKCIPCNCEVVNLCGLGDDDEEEDDFPKGPYSRYQPSMDSFGCYPPFPKPQPDFSQKLLEALLASHERHLKMVQDSHKRELEMLLIMHERQHYYERDKKD